jgi:hypothetical protein
MTETHHLQSIDAALGPVEDAVTQHPSLGVGYRAFEEHHHRSASVFE